MTSLEKLLVTLVGMGATTFCAASVSAQTISPAPFTQAQSDAGRQTYAASCASCHGDRLDSKGAPALAGKEFANGAFGRRPVAQLYTFIHNSMPFCEGGSLATDAYVNVVAFILQANGAKPGNEPLTPTTGVKLGDIITGETPPEFFQNAKSN
ncbi:MAG TPA: cytochrome c [Rhizomicrobium sp.]|nr:cytochrome c [Rhizomicrobium sp.]